MQNGLGIQGKYYREHSQLPVPGQSGFLFQFGVRRTESLALLRIGFQIRACYQVDAKGLPGRLTSRLLPLIPAVCLDNIAVATNFSEAVRISSPKSGIIELNGPVRSRQNSSPAQDS